MAYQVGWADPEARENRAQVMIQGLGVDERPAQLGSGGRRDHSPEWSPDGTEIAFLSRRGPRDQLVVMPAAGGEERQLTDIRDGVTSFRWSPDGSRLAFTANVVGDPDGVVDDPRGPESDDQVRRTPVARIARGLQYKHDGAGYVDGRYPHLFVIPAAGGEGRQLTEGAWPVEGYDWAPDSARLVLVGDNERDSDLRRTRNLYLCDLHGTLSELVHGRELAAPAWSPVGDQIAFLGPAQSGSGYHDRIWVVPATGGQARCLTRDFDHGVGAGLISDMRGGHGSRLVWGGGSSIHFQATAPGTAGLWQVLLDGSDPTPTVGGRRGVYDFDVRDGLIAFCAGDALQPGEAYTVSADGNRKLTDLNSWLTERFVSEPEHHQFSAADGWKIEGWLLKPPDFDPSRKYPLVLEIHGGPHAMYGWTFFHELQVLAGQGHLVLYVNPRGSDGYGEAFKRACVLDWGGSDYEDLMTCLDQAIERTGCVDIERMGVGGGSYGGFMTNWIIGHTDRFAAAVAMRSISNLVSEYAQHDIVLWSELEMGPPPWPDPDELWKRSPIRYVRNMNTPLLLTHGEMDLRCAISQAEELFGALRLLGRTVEMVRFPGESHDLSRNGRPDRRVERLDRIADWFGRYLLDQAQPQPAAEGRTVTA